jgi:hypothetical protein
MLHMPCQMQEMHEGKLYICYKGAPTHPTEEIKHTPSSPANEWKLLDLGFWWKYQLVGHVWVHGSKLSFVCLCCLSENDTSLLCAWFWNGALCSLHTYGTGAIILKWDMGILVTKVTHGVCDPKELRARTSSGNVLCLGSGLSNTRLFAGRPRHQWRTQKLVSLISGLPIQLTIGKIRIRKTMRTRNTKGRSRECDASTWKFASPLADAKSSETLENERTDIPRTGCLASSPSSRGVTQSCSGTPSGPRVHLPCRHQEL